MGMIFYGFYLNFYDLIKDVQVVQNILALGKEQRPDKTLKIPVWNVQILCTGHQNLSFFCAPVAF